MIHIKNIVLFCILLKCLYICQVELTVVDVESRYTLMQMSWVDTGEQVFFIKDKSTRSIIYMGTEHLVRDELKFKRKAFDVFNKLI